MRWLGLLVVLIGMALADSALALPQPDAEEAYARGDYATAYRIWLPLAEQGSARAQMNIGRMYERGEGVPQDQTAAAQWYRKAAEQSVNDASLPQVPMQANLANAVGDPTLAPPVSQTVVPLPGSPPASMPVYRPVSQPTANTPAPPPATTYPASAPAPSPVVPYRLPVFGFHPHWHGGGRH